MPQDVEEEALAVQGQPKEKMCPQCFEINSESSTFCQLCGASLGDAKEASEGSDVEVYKELAHTNLLRMRGQYKDAIQVCLGILKKYPNNATAHTLLGDVHAEMNELSQAAEWYEMALDLNPKSDADKQKLASVKKRIQEKERAQTAEQIGLAEARQPKPGLYIALAAAAIVVVAAGSFFLGQMMNQKPKPAVTQPVTVGGSEKPAADEPGPTEQEGGTEKKEDPAPASDPQPQASAGPSGPDRTTLEFLKARGANTAGIFAVVEDPRARHLVVMAESSGSDPASAAGRVAADVFELVSQVDKVTVKVIQGGSAVYMADAARSDYDSAKAGLTEGQTIGDAAAAFLTNTWPAAQ